MSNPIRPFKGIVPRLGARVYVDPAATVIGDVELGDDVSVWPGAVLRGDVHHIRIGARSNVQDGAIVHVTHDGPYTPGGFPALIGADVTIGHGAVIHACTIEDACLIGMHATVLDGAVVRKHGFVGAGALVPRARSWVNGSCGWAIRRPWCVRCPTGRSSSFSIPPRTTCGSRTTTSPDGERPCCTPA